MNTYFEYKNIKTNEKKTDYNEKKKTHFMNDWRKMFTAITILKSLNKHLNICAKVSTLDACTFNKSIQ